MDDNVESLSNSNYTSGIQLQTVLFDTKCMSSQGCHATESTSSGVAGVEAVEAVENKVGWWMQKGRSRSYI